MKQTTQYSVYEINRERKNICIIGTLKMCIHNDFLIFYLRFKIETTSDICTIHTRYILFVLYMLSFGSRILRSFSLSTNIVYY